MSKNFLSIHVLSSHSPSCLNRDDMNMQKSAIFGGCRRLRISSQCLKRAMRKSDAFSSVGTPSLRTSQVGSLAERFQEQFGDRFEPELVQRVVELISPAKEGKKYAVSPWSLQEVERVCQLAAEIPDLNGDEKSRKKAEKALQKELERQAASIRRAMAATPDIALFGRMATSGLMTSVDGAMAVAHAITTHAVEADIDWFTAVDDLTAEEGESGAGHLNTQEFGAGVFYRYASLNLSQLAENLGGAQGREACRMASRLAGLMATVVPSGKQQSFAAFNNADLVLASFDDLPLSHANAFEKPVQRDVGGGFLQPSISELQDYVHRVRKGYGLDGPQAVFSLWDTSLQRRLGSLQEMVDWIGKGGEDS
ncbi:MAG: type I-E CRISPR-associated protein Cas7/Cse4/CasC [Acidobacteriota bacterium]